MRKVRLLLSSFVLVLLVAACGTARLPEPNVSQLALSISPDAVRDGEIGVPYTFTLRAIDVRANTDQVTFSWSFAGGGNGKQKVAVVDGAASLDVTQAYAEAGVYALAVAVNGRREAAAKTAILAVGGAEPERDVTLASCGDWVTSKSGAYGVTIDRWDISSVPAGAVFDLKYDTISIPDKMLIDYPGATAVHDTGWRGDAEYNGAEYYPGGVVGGAVGTVNAVFTKGTANEFSVTVLGPDPKTKWSYEVRCRID